jgi:hypothetical protein
MLGLPVLRAAGTPGHRGRILCGGSCPPTFRARVVPITILHPRPASDGGPFRSGLLHRNPCSAILACAGSRCPPVAGCAARTPRDPAWGYPSSCVKRLNALRKSPDDEQPAEGYEGGLPPLRCGSTALLLGVGRCIEIERGIRNWRNITFDVHKDQFGRQTPSPPTAPEPDPQSTADGGRLHGSRS